MFSFSSLQYHPVPLPIQPTSLPSSVTFLTYNVLFDRLENQNRCISILEHIVKYKPSIACLLEVTAPFLWVVHQILNQPINEHHSELGKQIQELYLFTGDLKDPQCVIPTYGVFMFVQKSLPGLNSKTTPMLS